MWFVFVLSSFDNLFIYQLGNDKTELQNDYLVEMDEDATDNGPPYAKKQKLDTVCQDTPEANKDEDTENSKPEEKVVDKASYTPHTHSEVDCGMTEYLSSLPGFSGIIKQR